MSASGLLQKAPKVGNAGESACATMANKHFVARGVGQAFSLPGLPPLSAGGMRVFRVAGFVSLLICLSACDPPGKPGNEDELAAPSDFKTLYAMNCSGCHGENGRQGPGRVLNDPLYLAVSTKENIHTILVHGRAGTLMPPFARSNGGQLTDKQIDILVDGIESDWAKPFDPKGTTMPSYDGAGFIGDVAHGKKLFVRGCYACHAKGGVAGPINDPSYLSLSSNQNLRTSIIVGRPDFPGVQMPDYRSLNAGHALDDQGIADLVSYLASLRPPNSAMAMLEMQKSAATEQSKKPDEEHNK